MKIKLTDQAVEWFKDELDLPENNKSFTVLRSLWW